MACLSLQTTRILPAAMQFREFRKSTPALTATDDLNNILYADLLLYLWKELEQYNKITASPAILSVKR